MPLNVTTTTATSPTGGARPRSRPKALPGEDGGARQGQGDRDDEEEEAGREGRVGADVQLAEEADKEGLAHRQSVDRERNEHDEEEQRSHHVVRPRREVDADRLSGGPDREHAARLE